jgi:putative endonuclease
MTWYVYVLSCADESLYCGITNDLGKRLAAHNSGKGAKYTRGRTPVRFVYIEKKKDKGEALKRELKIKSMRRKRKMDFIGLKRELKIKTGVRGGD